MADLSDFFRISGLGLILFVEFQANISETVLYTIIDIIHLSIEGSFLEPTFNFLLSVFKACLLMGEFGVWLVLMKSIQKKNDVL